MEVELTAVETLMGAQAGVYLRVKAIFKGFTDRVQGRQPKDQWGNDIYGQMAEVAFCKAIEVFYSGDTQSFKNADVFDHIQIRSTPHASGNLILSTQDNPNHLYVLVVGDPPKFRIVGSIWGHEAKVKDYWRTDVQQPSFWIPQSKLKPFQKEDERFQPGAKMKAEGVSHAH